ncbi:MAG: TaqI-like C-terminal specificity domain-containing protein [Chitinophagales bacterium]|nr:TaqI-like C-terminal specificity domain-containing protein [Chitinophagales bacterium]
MDTSFESAFKKVKVLVEDFQKHSARYLRTDYKEQEVRDDFINPFFDALGWDVSHREQRDPFHQEVKVEKSEREGRVDYAFRKAPDFKNPVFFVEAKKPSVDIKNELHYLQTIKYAWNAGLPVSILTDFQQLHILDTRNKAKANDGSAFTGDHKEYHFTDYANEKKFAEIYFTFSREAIEKGNLDAYVQQLRKPKGKAIQTGLFKGAFRPVDEDFLAYIDDLREELAKALKKNNEDLQSEALTEATQRIIDRLVFIRFLEDKEILEDYLIDKFGAKGNTWSDFISACLLLNTQYNGVVFKKHFIDDHHFKGPDETMFRDICRDICHLNTDYNFRYIPIHILGSIYERFLGKVVHATDKRVKIEEKPEVRKAGGVYYTPKYIVEYIVENTVGKIIGGSPSPSGRVGVGLTPKEIAKLRFADIACGSGSFLISVYEHLLDYHTLYYNKYEHIVAAQKDGCRKDEEGVWQLSIEQKQDILRNNIYGVDIDAQAVEVSQLSLYLKMLENENVVTVAKHLHKKGRLFGADKILPDLSGNIKCGNSLIGSDILSGQLFADEELKKLNPFDYATEFKDVFKNGGFDAIVGNPPYVRQELIEERTKKYFKQRYQVFNASADLYVYFFERATSLLNQKSGRVGYIANNKWMRANYGKPLRIYLENVITDLIDFGDLQVFHGAITYPCIVLATPNRKGKFLVTNVKTLDFVSLQDYVDEHGEDFPMKLLTSEGWNTANSKHILLTKKMAKESVPLKEFVNGKIYYWLKTGFNEAFVINEATKSGLIKEDSRSAKIIKPFLAGRDVKRYQQPTNGRYLIFIPKGFTNSQGNKPKDAWHWLKSNYTAVAKHLANYEKTATQRDDQGDYWWELRACDYYSAFEQPKIIIPAIAKVASYTYDNEGFYSNDKTSIIPSSDTFLIGIINSKPCDFFLKSIASTKQNGYFEYKPMYLYQLPIPKLNLSNKPDKHQHDQIVSLVTQMLDSKQKQSGAKTDKDKEYYTRKCEALDAQIDAAVYVLYGLTEEEIKIVEGA